MFSTLQHYWEAGLEAPLIEEMISSAFSDFAPYAGAEQQQMRFVRQQVDTTTTSVVYEENGDWAVNVENPYVGGVAFSTRREFMCDVRAKFPLRRGDIEGDNKNNINSNNNNNNIIINNNNNNNNNNVDVVSTESSETHEGLRRFISSAALPPSSSRGQSGTVGVLELLLSPALERYGVGMRLGPFSLRTTTRPRNTNTNDNNNNNSESIDSTQMDLLRRTPLLIEGGWCTSLRPVLPAVSSLPFLSSLHMSAALQHPVGAGVEGDTLAALCFHSEPHTPHHRDTFRLLVVQTLMTSRRASKSLSDDDTGRSRGALFLGGASWRDLGTLIGVSKSFGNGLLRLSASMMIHDSDVDYEAAAMFDATPFFASPTQMKVGVNKVNRIGVGISTKIFDGLRLTLGIHHVRGEDTRFGLEIAM